MSFQKMINSHDVQLVNLDNDLKTLQNFIEFRKNIGIEK